MHAIWTCCSIVAKSIVCQLVFLIKGPLISDMGRGDADMFYTPWIDCYLSFCWQMRTLVWIETIRYWGRFWKYKHSCSIPVRTVDQQAFKGYLFTRRILLPTTRWKSPKRRERAVMSTKVTLATFHLHRISQEFLGQDCPIFNCLCIEVVEELFQCCGIKQNTHVEW